MQGYTLLQKSSGLDLRLHMLGPFAEVVGDISGDPLGFPRNLNLKVSQFRKAQDSEEKIDVPDPSKGF